MAQGKYVSEDIQDLLRRSEQILGEIPVLDLTNWHTPLSMAGTSCSRIILKNDIIVTDANIVICTGTATTTCAAAGVCPTGGVVSPTKYVNMIATVNLVGVVQTGVIIQFNYLINDIPVTDPLLTNVTVDLVPGNNSVYLFPTNHSYNPDTSITLYGASVISS